MFDAIFPKHWTTLQRLMWLKTNALARAVYETITGNPVSFTAKAAPLRKLQVAFSPVQSLNGYDSPWPAGGGKNLANVLFGSQVPSVTNGQMVSVAGWASDYIPIDSSKEYVVSFSGNAGRYLLFYASDKSYLGYDTGFASGTLLSDSPYFANTGYVKARSEANSTDDPFMQLEVGTTPTSFAPYSNECPISGWSSLTVEQRGKNLLDLAAWLDSIGIQYTVDNDGWFVANSTSGNSGNVYTNVYTLPLIQGSAFMELDQSRTTATNLRMSLLRNGTQVAESGTGNPSVAKIENREFNQFRLNFGSGGTFCIKVSVVNATTISEYTPYNPSSRSISISLGSTVYSGYVDVVTGVVTVTHIKQTITSVTPWGATANGYAVYVGVSGATHIVSEDQKPSLVSNIFTWNSFNGYANMGVFTYGGTSGAPQTMSFILPSTVTSKAEANAWFAENPTECTFALATPQTIQLTPQEVESLAGDNTMWTDGDSLTVEYRSN